MVFTVNFKIGLSIVAKTKGHLSFPLEWSPGMKSFNETASHRKVKVSSKSFVECNSKWYNLETFYIRPKIHPRINYSKLSHYTPKNQFSCHHFLSWHYSRILSFSTIMVQRRKHQLRLANVQPVPAAEKQLPS